MDTINFKYQETLAATVIKNLEKRQMEGYYCPTVEDAEKLAFSFLKDGQTVSFGGSKTLEENGMLTALRHDPSLHLLDRSPAKTPDQTKKNRPLSNPAPGDTTAAARPRKNLKTGFQPPSVKGWGPARGRKAFSDFSP